MHFNFKFYIVILIFDFYILNLIYFVLRSLSHMEPNLRDSDLKKEAESDNYYKIVKPLRTYERDISESVREKKPSQISINLEEKRKIKEQNKEAETQTNLDKTTEYHSHKKIIFILFLASITILITVLSPRLWNIYKTKNIPEIPVLVTENPIKSDALIKIDTTNKTREEIIALIEQEIQNLPTKNWGGLITIYPIEITSNGEKVLSGEKFLGKMVPNIPSAFLRALDKKLTFGYQIKAEGYMPFLVLEVNSFENAYSNMLVWENTIELDTSGFITTETEDLSGNIFQDQIIQNKDMRVLRRNNGSIAIMYSFLNNKTLFLGNNKETFTDVLAIINP